MAEAQTDNELPRDLSDTLKKLGFDPGIPVYEVVDFDFDFETIKKALFHSTPLNPVTLPFHIGESGRSDSLVVDVDLQMVVELVQAYYGPGAQELDSELLDWYDEPDWYIRGFLQRGGSDSCPGAIRMHALVATSQRDKFSYAIVQIVRQPSGCRADSCARLRFGDAESAK